MMIFLAFLIGTHKMLQVIVATVFISLISLSRSGMLTILSHIIIAQGTIKIFWFWPESIALFLNSAKVTTWILIFISLLFYILQYTSISVNLNARLIDSKLFQLILAPIAILTMLLSFSVAVLWIDLFSLTFLDLVQERFWKGGFLYIYIQYLPIGLLLHALLWVFLLFPKTYTRKTTINYDEDIYEQNKTIYEKTDE